jgi:hypothetical protein
MYVIPGEYTLTHMRQHAGNALPLSPPSEGAELAAGEAASSPEDGGFVIHCSQVYQRTQSSQQPERVSQVTCADLVPAKGSSGMMLLLAPTPL